MQWHQLRTVQMRDNGCSCSGEIVHIKEVRLASYWDGVGFILSKHTSCGGAVYPASDFLPVTQQV